MSTAGTTSISYHELTADQPIPPDGATLDEVRAVVLAFRKNGKSPIGAMALAMLTLAELLLDYQDEDELDGIIQDLPSVVSTLIQHIRSERQMAPPSGNA